MNKPFNAWSFFRLGCASHIVRNMLAQSAEELTKSLKQAHSYQLYYHHHHNHKVITWSLKKDNMYFLLFLSRRKKPLILIAAGEKVTQLHYQGFSLEVFFPEIIGQTRTWIYNSADICFRETVNSIFCYKEKMIFVALLE